MPPISTILLGFLVPALATAFGLAAAWRVWDKSATVDGRWIGGPLFGLAFGMAFWNLRARPHFPPGTGDVIEWVFYLAVGLGILGFLDALLRPPVWLRAIGLLILWRLVIRVMLWPLIPGSLILWEEWIDFLGLAAIAWWWSLETVTRESPGLAGPLLLLILSIGAAAILTSWHIVGSATAAAGAAAICVAATAAAAWRGRISLERGAATAIALPLLALLIHGYFFTSDTLTPGQQFFAGLVLISPMLALAGDLPFAVKCRPLWRLAIRLLPVILAVGAAAAWSLHQYAQADQAQQQDE
jgi:hypothetical protein